MNLHEYQAKQLFARYGIPVPAGVAADTVEAAREAGQKVGGTRWVVKAQVHAGGRGKAGGVKVVEGLDPLTDFAHRLLGSHLKTGQSGGRGLPVNTLLVEATAEIDRELYLSALVDRATRRIVVMASKAGGMEIEEVAARDPAAILTASVDPVAGLQPYQGRRLAFGLGLQEKQVTAFVKLLAGVVRLFQERDASLVEINPLVVTRDGELLALDGKINLDDSALYRQQELAAWRDATQEEEKEHAAHQHGLNYITLDGDIACMVNGAGLAMATMDIVKLHGGAPANFLDVGGGTTAAKVAEAFKLILSGGGAGGGVKAILVNIFGGIVRCDLIAEGIIQAVREVEVAVPVVARLEGTNAEQGRAMLAASGMNIIPAEGLTDAAKKAVEAARSGGLPSDRHDITEAGELGL